ncbi:hypothetical protein Nmel_018803 [Mimus melanotis]
MTTPRDSLPPWGAVSNSSLTWWSSFSPFSKATEVLPPWALLCHQPDFVHHGSDFPPCSSPSTTENKRGFVSHSAKPSSLFWSCDQATASCSTPAGSAAPSA